MTNQCLRTAAQAMVHLGCGVLFSALAYFCDFHTGIPIWSLTIINACFLREEERSMAILAFAV